MADIAILVAEEYERRMKNCPRMKLKVEEGGAGDRFERLSLSLVCPSASSFAERTKKQVTGEDNKKLGMARWVSEPKSPLSLGALDGFFSA